MRTTVTLDPDAELVVRERMELDRVSFKQALNDAIRAGGQARRGETFRTRTFDLGEPTVDLKQALRVAAELEDDAIRGRLAADG